MKHIFLILFGLHISHFLFAQSGTPGDFTKGKVIDWSTILTGKKPDLSKNAREVKGIPFVFEEYFSGSVYLNDSIHSPDLYKFKLNIFTNEIWMQNASGVETILTNPRILGLSIVKDTTTHLYKRLVLPSNESQPLRKFVEIFYCGSMTLIKEIGKTYVGPGFADKGIALVTTTFDTYETKVTYYLADENGSIKKLQLRLSNVFELFPTLVKTHKSKIDNYCKLQNINKNLSEEELTALLGFISALKNSY